MFVLSKNNLYLGFPPTEIGHLVTGEISDLVVRRYFCIDLAIVGQTSSATSDAAILLDAWRWTNENASSTAASSLDLRFLIRLSFSTLNQFLVSGESISRLPRYNIGHFVRHLFVSQPQPKLLFYHFLDFVALHRSNKFCNFDSHFQDGILIDGARQDYRAESHDSTKILFIYGACHP